jgi:hypothetical protein
MSEDDDFELDDLYPGLKREEILNEERDIEVDKDFDAELKRLDALMRARAALYAAGLAVEALSNLFESCSPNVDATDSIGERIDGLIVELGDMREDPMQGKCGSLRVNAILDVSSSRPENAARNQRGRPFAPGQSGNPAGKPKGARHRTTLLAERLMQTDVVEVVHAVINQAKGGDTSAAKLILERIAPVRRGAAVQLELPELRTPQDVGGAIAELVRAMAEGQITVDEALTVSHVLESRLRAIETIDLDARLSALESRVGVA